MDGAIFNEAGYLNCISNFSKLVRAKKQSEWICDGCLKCGDRKCCPGSHFMLRLPKTEDVICSDCLEKTQSAPTAN
jgi:hypothetical protein